MVRPGDGDCTQRAESHFNKGQMAVTLAARLERPRDKGKGKAKPSQAKLRGEFHQMGGQAYRVHGEYRDCNRRRRYLPVHITCMEASEASMPATA